MSNNPIGQAAQWWREYGLNPMGTAALLGLGVYGIGRAAWSPIIKTYGALAKPLKRMRGASEEEIEEFDKELKETIEDSEARIKTPRTAGLITGLLAAYLMSDSSRRYNGLLSWDSPYKAVAPTYGNVRPLSFGKEVKDAKKSSKADEPKTPSSPPAETPDSGMSKNESLDGYANLDTFPGASYMPSVDWDHRIGLARATELFTKDPFLNDDPYTRNLGLSIVTGAGLNSHSNAPTLGSVFDSAVQKIDNKLTFQGVADTAVKAVVANGLSRLFAGAVGTMCGLSDKAKDSLINAGTWAGTVSAILH